MVKVEVPTSVTLYVQWILHPFEKPQVAEQKSANSKWALAQTKELLKANSIGADDVQLAVQFNGKILLKIADPEQKVNDGDEFWKNVLDVLTKSNDIESISVYVNNDTSEKIACSLADTVNSPWHQVYQGYGTTTLIFHR